MLSENLVGQKCRPFGTKPGPADAVAEDYFYTVVAAWLEPSHFSQNDATVIGYHIVCALVTDGTGGTNQLPFMNLEFANIKTPGALYK